MLVEDALIKESDYDLSNKTTENDKESQDQNTDSLENKTNEGISLKYNETILVEDAMTKESDYDLFNKTTVK